MSELVFVYAVRVVEEKIVLASQLHLHLVDLAMHRSVQQENFDTNGFKCADLLRAAARVLNPQLKRRLAIKHHDVALCERGVQIVDCLEVEVVQYRNWLLRLVRCITTSEMSCGLLLVVHAMPRHAISIVHHDCLQLL